jgi:ATP-dependent DNA helicase DinG
VTLDEVSCLGPRCTYYKDCYAFRARKQAAKAGLVITNYALLLADLQLGKSIMGRFGSAVLDEAHRLESEAVRAFTARLPLAQFARFLEQVGGQRPKIAAIDKLWKSLSALTAPATAQEFCHELSSDLSSATERIRSLLTGDSRGGKERIRFLFGDPVHQVLTELWYHHGDSYRILENWLLETVASLVASGDAGNEPQLVELKRRLTRLSGYIKLLKLLGSTDEPEAVMWGDVSTAGETTLTVAPADVGGLLAKQLFNDFQAVVLTSATLDSADDFSWISRQLGLTAEHDFEPRRLKLGSPFPLSEQLLISLAQFLPPPDSDRYPLRLAQLLVKLRRRLQVSTLVLCTSYRMIEALKSSLEQQERIPGRLLVQSPGKSPERLLTQFRQNDRAMLIGTESFWEGVDLPDDFLRLLVLTRLPFPVPDDPLQLAKSERALARGENPFTTVSLPTAILKYRQALGRVIRGLSDWGAVVITDSRMARKRYGSLFCSAAAAEVHTQPYESLLIKSVSDWLKRWCQRR